MVRVFANGPGGRGAIQGRVIPKTPKMVLNVSLLNTQHYMVRIKGKIEQSRERSSTLPYTSVSLLSKSETWGSPSTTVANFTYSVGRYIHLCIHMYAYIILRISSHWGVVIQGTSQSG